MHQKYSTIKKCLILIAAVMLLECSSKKSEEQALNVPPIGNFPYEVSEDKSKLEGYYELDYMKEWYPERILPPKFDYAVDISKKSVVELWLLRSEVFARNGYLFEDAVLRGYFNQNKWYQPVFDVADFKVQLNEEEKEFVDKVLAREQELLKDRYVMQGEYSMVSFAHVYNETQFKAIDERLRKMLMERNMAIADAPNEQLFHVYDNNSYQYIPHFITTDIYLQVLHKHFSSILQKTEEEKFIPLLSGLLDNLLAKSKEFENTITDESFKKASQWSSTYLSVASNLLKVGKADDPVKNPYGYEDEETKVDSTKGDPTTEISKVHDVIAVGEINSILEASAVGSRFLSNDLFQYAQFKLRGNYTKSADLKRYFRCMKWLNTAPMFSDEDERFLSAALIASFIRKSPEQLKAFERFNEAIKFIVGDEDNLSMSNLVASLSDEQVADPSLLNDPEILGVLREKILKLNVDKIKPKAGDDATGQKLSRPAVLFTAGRYTFDAEILSRLIHVLRPEPKRTFPKGLDVFATMGNKLAENILMNEFKEGTAWKQYPDSLQKLKKEFGNYSDWNRNIYGKTFEMIKSISNTDTNAPVFMKSPAWDKKNLITSLAAWTELKHDMLLYTEQPSAAQAGQGGGPPPPIHLSYVEPNVTLWKKALELIDMQEATLTKQELMTDDVRYINERLRELGNRLLAASEKEIAHQDLTKEELDYLSWIGGTIEGLTFSILGTDRMPDNERMIAVVADVYNYNGVFLEEAVGMADEIYVIAEINGKPYLTRGAMFSYYEFKSPQPMTDEEWVKQLSGGKAPPRPSWVKDITLRVPSLESKASYSF